jgi:hypothetical protein
LNHFGAEAEWIEVWLSSHSKQVVDEFLKLLNDQNIKSRDGFLKFPERSVVVILADYNQLEELSRRSDHIAEYRRASSLSSYWTDLPNKEQGEWVDNLLGRLKVSDSSASTVCILDTGVNAGHPLLTPILSLDSCLSVNTEWGVNDHHRHGTLMAGVAAYGNLQECLESNNEVEINHRLESVKILPPPPAVNHKDLWGYITSQAVSQIEIQNPKQNRTICMAVTSSDGDLQGRPSSWSAQLDNITFGSDYGVEKLVIVSAGNIGNDITKAGAEYPNPQINCSVQDPAQSWNALTVGAYTELVNISDPDYGDYLPVAGRECLSPFTSTSTNWENNKWPIKPEVVMEGGNLAIDDSGFVTECADLSVLSLNKDPHISNFTSFNMTSAASAKLAYFSGELQSEYPGYWPETIRALIVHSSNWPDGLKRQFLQDESKTSYRKLLDVCGYGVPSLERAKYSASNELTLVSEATIQPFDKKPKGGFRSKDMHIHELPWPSSALLSLPPDTPIEMRVTLSYFIEPGPGEIGWKDRYRYASHGLRFDLNSPEESKYEFMNRINREIRDADEGRTEKTKSPSERWVLGSQARDRGSIHSDIWRGSAADLATSNMISVAPVIGWWRERQHLGRWASEARYSLVVSIDTPSEEVDLYTEVATTIESEAIIEIEVDN